MLGFGVVHDRAARTVTMTARKLIEDLAANTAAADAGAGDGAGPAAA